MIGSRLKLARSAAGISLRELSARIDNRVTAQAIGKYERDESSNLMIRDRGLFKDNPKFRPVRSRFPAKKSPARRHHSISSAYFPSSAHSHTIETRHPSPCSSIYLRSSLALLSRNFSFQKSRFDFGTVDL